MFRENVLVKDEIIDRVASRMVPVSLDYQKILRRESKEAHFLLPLMKQRSDKQGVWIFTPRGEFLGGFVGFGDMVGKTRKLIDTALKKFGPVEPRKARALETHPFRGKRVMPDGSVCLAEYVRRRDPDRIKSPVISSVVLSRAEFESFAPRDAAVGETWALPESVARRLCRVASPMCYQHAPQPDWVTAAVLEARVRSIRNGLAELIYEGRISSRRVLRSATTISTQELALEGEGVYDISLGKMRSLLIVGTGTFRWPEEAPDSSVLFDALIEWEREPRESSAPATSGDGG